MADHALLSPSSAHRWLRCPGSVILTEGMRGETSEHAEEGTAAHALADACLRLKLDAAAPEALHEVPPHLRDYVDEDMQIHVQDYVDRVRGFRHDLLMPEQRLSLDAYIPGAWGTVDAVCVGDGRAIVSDLKYGRGVAVNAHQNEQLMLYALGVDEAYGWIYGIETYDLWIHQPRNGGSSSWEMPAAELRRWGRDVVAPVARRIANMRRGLEPRELVAGEKQCRWCLAKPTCPALAAHALETARQDFGAPPVAPPVPASLTIDEVAQVLPRLDVLEDWAKAVRDHALSLAKAGTSVPGYKLVEGRANRKWRDVEAAMNTLLDAGASEDDIYRPDELIGIPDAEKLLRRLKQPVTLLEPVTIKPAGSLSLVPVSDPRPALVSSTPEQDFQPENAPWD